MQMGEKRVLVVVLASDSDPWRTIQNVGQKGTWAAQPAMPVMWLHGKTRGWPRFIARAAPKFLRGTALTSFHRTAGKWAASRPVKSVGDRIETSTPETYLMTTAKTVAGFRHILAYEDFDYLLRTNSSSYLNLVKLQKFVQDLPSTGYYGGTLWEKNGLTYVTGTSILLSRDLVEYAASDPAWEFELIDDVALGKSMARAGVPPQPVPRIDVHTNDDLAELDLDRASSSFIIRCRGLEDRDHDIEAMRTIHHLLTTESATS